MTKNTLAALIALAIAAIAPGSAHALEGRVGVGISPIATYTNSSGYKPDSGAPDLLSINGSLLLPFGSPISIRAEFIREPAGNGFEEPTDIYGIGLEYQFLEPADRISPYVFIGGAVMTDSELGNLTVGRAGVGVRRAVYKGFELDANYSMILSDERIGILTVGINYTF